MRDSLGKKSNLFSILSILFLILVFVSPFFLGNYANLIAFIFSILSLVSSIIQIRKNRNIFAIIILIVSILVFLLVLLVVIMPYVWKYSVIPFTKEKLGAVTECLEASTSYKIESVCKDSEGIHVKISGSLSELGIDKGYFVIDDVRQSIRNINREILIEDTGNTLSFGPIDSSGQKCQLSNPIQINNC